MRFDQADFDVRCEWGLRGLRKIGPVSDVVIVVDILSFSTAVDIAAGRGLEEAVVQSIQIGVVNSWLRNQPAEIFSAAVVSLREALAPYANGATVRLRGAMWLIGSGPS